jgi:hypothetical protein
MNDLTDYLEYAKQQHRNAYSVIQTPGDAARNIAMEFMTKRELVKFSLECLVCVIRKILRHNTPDQERKSPASDGSI